jgi:PAS domain S-box-containing protein
MITFLKIPEYIRRARLSSQFFIWVFLISFVPLSAVAAIYLLLEADRRSEAMTQLSALADLHARRIERFAENKIIEANRAAADPTVLRALEHRAKAPGSENASKLNNREIDVECQSFLNGVATGVGFLNLLLFDANGELLFSTKMDDGFSGNLRTGAQRASKLASAFAQILTSKKSMISDFDFYESSRMHAAFVTAPVIRGDAVVGVLAIQLENQDISAAVNNYIGLGRSGESVVAAQNDNGAIFIAPTRHSPDAAMKPYPIREGLPMVAAFRRERGASETLDYRNIQVFAAWQYIPALRMGVVTKIDSAEVLEPLTGMRRIGVFTILFVIALLLTFTFLISRSIAVPLRSLVSLTDRFRAGDLSARAADDGPAEITALAQSLNSMAAEIQQSYVRLEQEVHERKLAQEQLTAAAASLEARIAERTAELRASNSDLERQVVERTKAEIERDRFFTLSLDMLSISGNDGYFYRLNPAFEKTLGYTTEEMLKKPFMEYVHPDDCAATIAAAEAIARGKSVDGFENRYRCKDGSYRWLAWKSVPLASTGLVYSTARDVTARKKSEDALLRLNEELTRKTTELAQKNEEVEAFVYVVSHDLRAPLVNLQGFSSEILFSCEKLDQLISQASLPADTAKAMQQVMHNDLRNSLKYIAASTQRIDRLINALLTLSRTGRQELKLEMLDVSGIVMQCLDVLQEQVLKSKATIVVGKLPDALADRTAVAQIFTNLIGNALNYLRPDRQGIIEIGGVTKASFSHYWVKDNGIGIPSGAHGRLFQVFQRFHPKLAKGEGMGLAIVKRAVERHGGKVWAESTEGEGTTFHLTLPVNEGRKSNAA